MTLAEYQEQSKRTLGKLSLEGLADNTLLGLIGEIGEIAEIVKKVRFHDKPFSLDSLLSECGDVLWYTAAEFSVSERSMNETPYKSFREVDDYASSRQLNDTHCVFGLFGTAMQGDVNASSDRLCLLSRLLKNHGSSLEEAAAKNIEKLQARYPNGFPVISGE